MIDNNEKCAVFDTLFCLRGLINCYEIAIGDCKVTPTLMFRQALRRRNISGAALRSKRKRVTDVIHNNLISQKYNNCHEFGML